MRLDIIFYHNESGSTSSQKVKLCLDYKGLDYKSINVDLGQKQNQSPEYLKINRHGLVPALSHDGSESSSLVFNSCWAYALVS